MALYGSMCSLILIISLWRDKHGSHHGKRTKCAGYHITHDITIIVFACPDVTAFGFHDTCNCIIDQCIEIGNSGFFKFFLILCVKDFLENVFKCMVIFFGNSVFGCKPQILLCI